jgi:hypothetical protein
MHYEQFLFTRNQRRDFTAFIRPKALTNKDVSNIASALNNINNVADLKPDWPSLYCFPIGEYVMLLRHYDSGRKHAGRDIGIIEGMAVRRTQARHFAIALPYVLAHQDEFLSVASTVPDIESAAVIPSPEQNWPEMKREVPDGEMESELIEQFAARLMDDRLFLPFTPEGLSLLMSALSDPHFSRLYFAFGTNAEVISRLNESDIDVDIVSYFNTTEPGFKARKIKKTEDEEAPMYMRGTVPEAPPRPTSDRRADALRPGQPTPQPAPEKATSDRRTDILRPEPTQKPAEQPAPPVLSVRWFANILAKLLKGG